MKNLLCLFVILVASLTLSAQRVIAPTGMVSINDEGTCYEVTLNCVDMNTAVDLLMASINDEGTCYEVTLNCVDMNTAVDLLVDHCIKARCAEPQQIGIYIVEFSKEDRIYTIFLDERVVDQEGYPMRFASITDVRKQLKLCLKFDLENV